MEALNVVQPRAPLGDLQANILRPVEARSGRYELFEIRNADELRKFLLAHPSLVSTENTAEPRAAEPCVTLGFTFAGLRALGISKDRLGLLPEPFVEGMANRAQILGDVGRSAPELWEGRFGTGAIHGVLCLGIASAGGDDDPGAQCELAALWHSRVLGPATAAAAPGHLCDRQCALPGTETLERCFGSAETDAAHAGPFGFRDPVSQPVVEEFAQGQDAAPDELRAPLRLGEFVLGYPDEWERLREIAKSQPGSLAGKAPSSIAGGELARDLLWNGTYMVLRKLEHDLKGFQAEFGGTVDGPLRAVQAVGRWKNGVPVSRPIDSKAPLNDFSYVNADGVPTPEGLAIRADSHIRRAHPRSEKSRDLVRLHRIIRRGMPYAQQDSRTGELKQGILFVCFNARIDDQFEFIQSVYLSSGSKVGLPSDAVDVFTRFSIVRGGEYFLVPSRSVLGRIARRELEKPLPEGSEGRERLRLQQIREDSEYRRSVHFDPLELAALPPEREERLRRGVERRQLAKGSVWLVAERERIEDVLRDQNRFKVEPYGTRIGEMAGPNNAMLTGSDDDRERKHRRRLFDELLPLEHGPRVANIAKEVLAGVERTHVVGRPIEWVSSVARAIPTAFMTRYLGIPVPRAFPSRAYTASHFGFRSGTPAEWKNELEMLLQASGQGAERQLQFWGRVAFAHTFGNLRLRPELRDVAMLAVAELRAHLESALEDGVASRCGSLLERGLSLEHQKRTTREELKMLLLELAVGSTEILARALTNLMNVLMDRREALQAARKPGADDDHLSQVIHECLRFEPVALSLPRRYVGTGPSEFQSGDLVCAMVGVASMDRERFPEPSDFLVDRPTKDYLTFGFGPHECPGGPLALAMMREVLRWLADSRFDPRRAAGPRGQKRERDLLPESLYVRLD